MQKNTVTWTDGKEYDVNKMPQEAIIAINDLQALERELDRYASLTRSLVRSRSELQKVISALLPGSEYLEKLDPHAVTETTESKDVEVELNSATEMKESITEH
tara:strand:+ start:29 stop:337 length:309 start_codon:yes stop_codon:yes gene_type:complete